MIKSWTCCAARRRLRPRRCKRFKIWFSARIARLTISAWASAARLTPGRGSGVARRSGAQPLNGLLFRHIVTGAGGTAAVAGRRLPIGGRVATDQSVGPPVPAISIAYNVSEKFYSRKSAAAATPRGTERE